MSLSVIGYLPNSDIQLHWELRSLHWRELPGVKITLKNLLNMCCFQDACIVSPQSNARCYFFFLWCFGEKTAISRGEDKIKWLVWLLGKCTLSISRLSPVGGSQNKRRVGTRFSPPKVNTCSLRRTDRITSVIYFSILSCVQHIQLNSGMTDIAGYLSNIYAPLSPY